MEKKERKRRPTPPLSVKWLTLEAVRHLERWPASERRIRELLWKRVKRAQSFHGGTREEAAPLVAEAMQALAQLIGKDEIVAFVRRAAHGLDGSRCRRGLVAHFPAKQVDEGLWDSGGEDLKVVPDASSHHKSQGRGPNEAK